MCLSPEPSENRKLSNFFALRQPMGLATLENLSNSLWSKGSTVDPGGFKRIHHFSPAMARLVLWNFTCHAVCTLTDGGAHRRDTKLKPPPWVGPRSQPTEAELIAADGGETSGSASWRENLCTRWREICVEAFKDFRSHLLTC